MKITSLYVYPIKSLRGIPIKHAELTPQGIKHDRVFMLYTIKQSTGEWRKMQLSSFPQCALFDQKIVSVPQQNSDNSTPQSSVIIVEYNPPKGQDSESGLSTAPSKLEVPLEPDISTLERVDVTLHSSSTSAYLMGDTYDKWFTSCLGIPVILVYIGDGKRPVLGETLVPEKQKQRSKPTSTTSTSTSTGGWMSSLTSYISSSLAPTTAGKDDTPWLTFTDVAPLLIASESSLSDVSSRLLETPPTPQKVQMYKFRPNIVVDGKEKPAWDEDFWGELTVTPTPTGTTGRENKPTTKLLLTGNCVRCTSLNVDYETGRPAEGELGTVLKKLMKDRRVDKGSKWSPVFGRYASVDFDFGGDGDGEGKDGGTCSEKVRIISVGDEVEVTGRIEERSVWDWPDL